MKTTRAMKQALPFLILAAALPAVLLAGCKTPTLEKPAPRAGVLRVSLGPDTTPARTLLPETNAAGHYYYTLTFTATGGPALTEGPGSHSEAIAVGQSSGEFPLEEGTWSLEVLGFADADAAADPDNALVSGGESDIDISADAGASVTVTLRPLATQSSTGTLAYQVSFPEGVIKASLAVWNDTGGLAALEGGAANPLDLIAAGTGGLTLDSGAYRLELLIYAADKALALPVSAHIYDGLVTRADYAFTEADFAEYALEALTAFLLNDGNTDYTGRINHVTRTVTVFVPSSVNTSSLTTALTYTGLAVSPEPAGTADYSGDPVKYTVILEDGVELVYTVRVSDNQAATVTELTALLSAGGGVTEEDPVLVKMSAGLTDGWAAILTAIQSAGKYVELDLSDCDMTGMTGTAGEFDPKSANTGERYITALVLPDAATSIKAGSYFDPTFRYFTGLAGLEASGVQTVGTYAFYDCEALTNVSLPAAATIGERAFSYCEALTSVSLPVADTIGDYAFSGCDALTSVSLPKATTIGGYAFSSCTALTDVSLPVAVTIGGDSAFAGCDALTNVSLPKAATIGIRAFYECGALTSVSLPKAATIGHAAFLDCAALTDVDLPRAATIGASAFEGCAALTSISLPATLTFMDANPFAACVNLSGISVAPGNLSYTARNGMLLNKAGTVLLAYPTASGAVTLDTVTTIGKSAFRDCAALTSVSLLKAATIDNSAFYGCAALTGVSLPKATTISASAFEDCDALTSVSLPVATTIGEYAFRDCDALTSVSLLKAATIGNYAFYGCDALTSVSLPAAPPTLGRLISYGISSPRTVTVKRPAAGADAYGSGISGDDTTTESWANAFRGMGWNGTSYGTGTVSTNITVVFEDL